MALLRWIPGPILLLAAAALAAAPLSPADLDALRDREALLQEELDEIAGGMEANATLDRYEQEYLRAVSAEPPRRVDPAQLDGRIAGAPLVLLADTHTLAASQARTRTVLETMRSGDGELTLVIEWVDRRFQPEVDAFLAGDLDEDGLRDCTRFDDFWGFPWDGYVEILYSARALGVPVLLVESLVEQKGLRERDRDISRQLVDHLRSHPGMRYLVVYGGWHLAGQGHLSERLERTGVGSPLVLLDSAPDAYWTVLDRVRDPEQLGYIRLGPDLFLHTDYGPLEHLRSERDYYLELMGQAD